MAGKAITKYAVLAILAVSCLTLVAQEVPTPRLVELKRNVPPHADITFSISRDATNVVAFKIVREVLHEGTTNGRRTLDRTSYVARDHLRNAVYRDGNVFYKFVEKKLPPHATTVYLFYVIALTEDGESSESNKIELHP